MGKLLYESVRDSLKDEINGVYEEMLEIAKEAYKETGILPSDYFYGNRKGIKDREYLLHEIQQIIGYLDSLLKRAYPYDDRLSERIIDALVNDAHEEVFRTRY